MIGAFSAVASTPHTYDGERLAPEALALPPAVLVHDGHGLAAAAAGPVAVALPTYLDGTIVVDAVFASTVAAATAAEQVRRGRRTVSIVAAAGYGTGDEYRYGVLVAVDLVARGADPGARITSTVDAGDLSPELVWCRRAFDAYLADLANPQQLDLGAAVERHGVRAFAPLAPVVAGIRDHHAAQARRRGADLAWVRQIVTGPRRASTSPPGAFAMAAPGGSKAARVVTPPPKTRLRPSP